MRDGRSVTSRRILPVNAVGVTPFCVDMVETDCACGHKLHGCFSEKLLIAACASSDEQTVGIAKVGFRYILAGKIATVEMSLQTPVEKRDGVINYKLGFQ